MKHPSFFAVWLLALSCLSASAQPVQQAGIPSPVLYAVALQESGLRWRERLIPWPWSLNMAGRALRFETRHQACAALRQALQQTQATRIDAGLA